MSPSKAGKLTRDDAIRILQENAPAFEKFAAAERARELEDQAQWAAELEMLQRRIRQEYESVDLGHGDRIKIRTRISLQEGRRVLDLIAISQHNLRIQQLKEFITQEGITPKDKAAAEAELKDLEAKPAVTREQQAEADAEILGIATLNPSLTKEYFLANPDKWSAVDTIPILVTFFETVKTKLQKVSQAATFRQK